MKQANPSFVIVGRIGSTYGIRGWLKIQSYMELAKNILDFDQWYLKTEQSDWVAVAIEDRAMHGKHIIAKFNGIETPEEARLLTGRLIGVQRTQLPKLKSNEYYWSDLVGLKVIDQNGQTLGTVIYLLATGSNDVLVIKNNKEHAIPFLLGEVIQSIDLEKKEIHVNWELI